MFWRRSKREGGASGARTDAGADDGLDDLAKLQRQFGIKPVSDADVQGEFQKLFGGASSGIDSPTAQLMRLVGDHASDGDDEEARILRELQVSSSFNLDDVEMSSGEEAGDREGDAADEPDDMRHVIAEAHHRNEQQVQAIESGDVRGIVSTISGQGEGKPASAMPEQVRELKMRALQLKREGNMPAALAMLREAKQLEASMTSFQEAVPSHMTAPRATPPPTMMSTASVAASAPATMSSVRVSSPVKNLKPSGHTASTTLRAELSNDEVEEADIQVTDDDMQDPEFLAQLARFGHVEDSDDETAPSKIADRLATLEKQIGEMKLEALKLKREGQIPEALACMRSMRELEKQRDELQGSQMAIKPVQVSYMADRTSEKAINFVEASERTTVAVTHGYAAPTPHGDGKRRDDSDDSDIEVTEDDMNDPSFQDELAKLGFSDDTTQVDIDAAPRQSHASAQPTSPATNRSPRNAPRLYNVASFDEEGLIDEFESDSEVDGDVDTDSAEAATDHQLLEIPAPSSAPESASSLASSIPVGSTVTDLQSQLDRTRRSALQLKRDGKLSEALVSLRRAKQIENLINLKLATESAASVPDTNTGLKQDPAVVLKFQELERLLVEFGNRAMASAKENLSSDRAAAAGWLAKRKEYAAQLDILRTKRQDPFQLPPVFSVSKTSQQVEFELSHVPDDCIRVEIRSVNGLSMVAGWDIYVQFSLGFPATAPHEGQTEPIRIQPDAPHSSGPLKPSKTFQFKLQRTRGTLRLLEIKKASFEVWRPGTLFRNPELVARGYQVLSPLVSKCEIVTRVPFVGSNRKPIGGDVEIALQLRRPLRDKDIREVMTEELVVGDYPEPFHPTSTHSLPQMPAATLRVSPVPQERTAPSSAPPEVRAEPEAPLPEKEAVELDPYDVELIVSYDVINEELEKIEAKLPSLRGMQAAELQDRLDSLALKKQLLEIEMQTGKLTLEMYTTRLHTRIADDHKLIASLMRLGRRLDAARVLRRVKIMEKELEGAEGGEEEEGQGVEL